LNEELQEESHEEEILAPSETLEQEQEIIEQPSDEQMTETVVDDPSLMNPYLSPNFQGYMFSSTDIILTLILGVLLVMMVMGRKKI
jgi:hypothetical protein